ncbi:MAG TPA: methylmalonyl-CoA carboxyltransferase [Firmicutes bacterium]|nr:methylmalonyl-CoA carboxyltransferase [Bacillota bacterium]
MSEQLTSAGPDRLQELYDRRARVEAGGGPERIDKQHRAGKLTARERLHLLFDPGTFVETDPFVRHRCTEFGMAEMEIPGEGVVTGFGRVDGRVVYAFSQDFTVMGGSLGEMHARKITKAMDAALKAGVPFVGLNDSGGARIQEGVDALDGYGSIFFRNTIASGVIPQISVIMGPCAGGAVYSPALTDFIFMVQGTGQMFITGPQVIKAVTGEEVSMEDLGGAGTHSAVSGVAHFFAEDERTCLSMVRQLLSYLPANNVEDPPFVPTDDPPDREEPGLREVVPADPNRPYDVHDVIVPLMDHGAFLEVHARYAGNIVVGFGRVGGRVVGVVANQPRVLAGCLDINASDKAARFVRFCDAFNVPLLTLVDTPGYLPGTAQEYGGIIRHGAKLLYAFSEATVPKITVILRKAYGGAYLAMCARSLGCDQALAWPSAEIAVMGPEGAANIIFREEISRGENPAQVRQEKIREYRERFANPYVAAARGYVDVVIDPMHTRQYVARSLEALSQKREARPAKKHGNFPA